MPLHLTFLFHPNSLWLARFLLASYCGLIIYLSLMPTDEQFPVRIWDKAAHALAYIGFTSIAALCTLDKKQYMHYLIGFFVFGVTIEIAQGMTDYRTFSFLDMLANSSGILIGFIICTLINMAIRLPSFSSSINSQ